MTFSRLFGKSPAPAAAPSTPASSTTSTHSTLDELNEMLRLVEARETHLERLIEKEIEKARTYHARNNKREAVEAIKRKRLHETEREQLTTKKLSLMQQQGTLQALRFTSAFVATEQNVAKAIEAEVKKVGGVDGVEQVQDRMDDALADSADILKASTRLMGEAADFDDDELYEELEQMELADALQQVVTTDRAGSSQAVVPERVPTHLPARESAAEREQRAAERELAELTALRSSMQTETPMSMPMMAACY